MALMLIFSGISLNEHVFIASIHLFPMYAKRVKGCNPWINRTIIHLKRRIKRLRKNGNRNKAQIPELQNELRTNVQQARQRYFSFTLPDFIKNDPDKFWRYLGNKQKSIDKIKVNYVLISDHGETAEQFNKYFSGSFLPLTFQSVTKSFLF